MIMSRKLKLFYMRAERGGYNKIYTQTRLLPHIKAVRPAQTVQPAQLLIIKIMSTSPERVLPCRIMLLIPLPLVVQKHISQKMNY